MSGGPDKALFQVRFTHTQRGHAFFKLLFLFKADWKRGHAISLLARGRKLKEPVAPDKPSAGRPGPQHARTPRRKRKAEACCCTRSHCGPGRPAVQRAPGNSLPALAAPLV